jgi:hypothetical protein
MDRIGSGTSGGGAQPETVTTASPVAVPSPENVISRFKARARERKVPAGRARHGDLTSLENGAKNEPRETRGLERRPMAAR